MLREFALIDAKQSSGGSQLRGGYHQQFFAKEINYDVLNIYNDMSSITSTGLLTFWPIGLMHSPDNPLRRFFLTSNRHLALACAESRHPQGPRLRAMTRTLVSGTEGPATPSLHRWIDIRRLQLSEREALGRFFDFL